MYDGSELICDPRDAFVSSQARSRPSAREQWTLSCCAISSPRFGSQSIQSFHVGQSPDSFRGLQGASADIMRHGKVADPILGFHRSSLISEFMALVLSLYSIFIFPDSLSMFAQTKLIIHFNRNFHYLPIVLPIYGNFCVFYFNFYLP